MLILGAVALFTIGVYYRKSLVYFSRIACCRKKNSEIINGFIVLPYTHNNEEYSQMIDARSLPCPIVQVLNEHGVDLTDIVLPYTGPSSDILAVKPKFFGCEKLIFDCGDSIVELTE